MLRHYWNNQRYGASNLRCPYVKEFIQKLSEILARTLMKICQSCPRPEKFKNCQFEGAPNYLPVWGAYISEACSGSKFINYDYIFGNSDLQEMKFTAAKTQPLCNKQMQMI
jgi:hypothetical protein